MTLVVHYITHNMFGHSLYVCMYNLLPLLMLTLTLTLNLNLEIINLYADSFTASAYLS